MAGQSLVLVGTPNPKQIEFFKSTARHTCYGGARGGGKSWAMRRKMVLLAINYPALQILILRRTLPELRENIVNPLIEELHGFTALPDSGTALIANTIYAVADAVGTYAFTACNATRTCYLMTIRQFPGAAF